jgi:hypothetical protein
MGKEISTHNNKAEGPATVSLRLSSRLWVWWVKVKDYAPYMVELGSFLFWIDFQVQAWARTCSHRTWHDYKFKFGLGFQNLSQKAGIDLETKLQHLTHM